MQKEKLFKKYSCPFCELISSRKFNMEIHIKRKHPPQQPSTTKFYRPSSSTNLYPYNELLHMETTPVLDSNNFIFHSTSSQYFHPIFLENSYYENIENEKRQEKRASERRFYQMIKKLMYYFIAFNNSYNNNVNSTVAYSQFPFYNYCFQIPSSYFPNNSNIINNFVNSKLFTDPLIKMPKGHRIYKCKRCSMETILPIFEFDDIPQEEKFVHKCEINSSEHYNKIIDHNDCYSIKLQELLLSITNSVINSERKVLEIFIIPEIIIQHPPCFFILEIIQNIFDLNLIPKWIFTILKTEKFIDLGEINCEHWACRAYDSENGIALKKRNYKT